jgi:hypothetical protein
MAKSSRSIPSHELARWLGSTYDAKLRILVANHPRHGWPWPPDCLQDRGAYRELVITLAEELYHRRRGSLPPSEEALVGTYLDRLPDDGSEDLADGPAPVVQ